MAIFISKELSTLVNTRVDIGRINPGLLNRIIIDDVSINDKSGKEMLKVARLSAKFEILPLFKGKITISSVQLFGFNISLNKETPDAPPNCQFLIDAFTSKDTIKKETNIDLRINSLLLRRGKLSYDVISAEQTPGKFNPQHIRLQNILANISLKALRNDSVNASIKRMSMDDQSGLSLKKLTFKLLANKKEMSIENFAIGLPGTSLRMDTIRFQYDKPEALEQFADDVQFSFRTLPSFITPKDIAPLVPALSHFKEKIEVDLDVSGTVNQMECHSLILNSVNKHFYLRGEASLQALSTPKEAYLFGKLSQLSADIEGIGFLYRNLNKEYNGVPPILQHLGDVSFQGEISGYFNELVTYGIFHTGLGSVKTDLKFGSNREKGTLSYSGAIETKELNLGMLLDNKELGAASFNFNVQGKHGNERFPTIVLKGLLPAIEYSNYKYENITIDGEYKNGGFNGKAALDDPNGAVTINGSINLEGKIPTFNFLASVSHLRPNELHLSPNYKDAAFSVKVNANFKGGSIDQMNGEIKIDSLQLISPEKNYFLRNIDLIASHQEETKHLTLRSEFMKATVEGCFSYKTLPAGIIGILRQYMPSLILPGKAISETENDFSFDAHIYNTDILPVFFNIPLRIQTHSTLKGYVNERMGRLRMEGYFPRLQYGGNLIESGTVLLETSADHFKANVRFTKQEKEGAVNISLQAQVGNDRVDATMNWGNSGSATYSGCLATITHFMRPEQEKQKLRAVVDVLKTNVILNDTIWQVHPSQVVIDEGEINVDNFYFSHQDRYVRVNGRLSDNPTDTVKIGLKEINLGYVFDIIQVTDDISFQGDVTGTAYAAGVLSKPALEARIDVSNFKLNDALLGNLKAYGAWDNDKKGIYIDGCIQKKNVAKTKVNGYIYTERPMSGLDLNIDADSLNIKFIEFYMQSIVDDIHGYASGKVHLYGPFNQLNLNGKAMTDASLKIGLLNTSFVLKDTIQLSPEGVAFNQCLIDDPEGHSGSINGWVRYKHFKNIRYQFDIRANNMLVMNTRETPDLPFFGTLYGTGSALLSGNAQSGLSANVAMTTNRNSTFTYNISSTSVATSNQFIRFIDKTPQRNTKGAVRTVSRPELLKRESGEKEQDTDIRLNIQVDATPDANMKIIMDPIAGDYISGRGQGNIRVDFYNKGDVNMFGNFRIQQGIYKFSLQEVIHKNFIIKDGSNITFNGNPLNATMDIQATYTVPSASLNDLIPDASSYVQQTNVRVNSIMNLTGNLLHPTIKLNIELPNERDEVQALVRNYISTEEQMNMQTLYLLGIGKFYMDNTNGQVQSSDMMTSVLSSTLSGQFNNVLSQILDNNNWNIGTHLSTGEKGWTEMEWEGMLSGQLLNNRLLINGNFGYRENPIANTNFVGDFEAEWLLTHSGDIRLKAYNKTNDRYYTKTNLTTQGIGILFRKDFNKWSEFFFWNKWKLNNTKKKIEKKEPAIQVVSKETSDAQSEVKRNR